MHFELNFAGGRKYLPLAMGSSVKQLPMTMECIEQGFALQFRDTAEHIFMSMEGSRVGLDLEFQALQTVPISDVYAGPYTATPSAREQVLPTAKLIMSDDLTIKEIPFFEVSNTAGGSTVYIGGNIEIY